MEPESSRIDLSPLDPGNWQRKSAALAARARQMRRVRRTVVVRGMTALALWFSAPSPEPQHAQPAASSSPDLFDWAIQDPTEVLRYAQ